MKIEKGRYQLRKAAGLYWLLDMKQEGREYCKPIPINECGASILTELEKDCTVQEIANLLAEKYKISNKQAECDIIEFIQQLKSLGILITEK